MTARSTDCTAGPDSFAQPTAQGLRTLLRQPVSFDGRILDDPAIVRGAGLVYVPIGRPATALAPVALALALAEAG